MHAQAPLAARSALPPLAPGWPVLGSALPLLRDPFHFFYDTYAALGPVYRVRVLHRELTVLAGPDANVFVSREGAAHLGSREVWAGFAAEVNAPGFLPALDGPAHTRARSVLKRGYSRAMIADRVPETVALTERLLAPWRAGDRLPVLDVMRGLITEQLGMLLVSRVPGPYQGDFLVFVNTILNVLVVRRWPRPMLWRPAYRRAKARVREFAADLLAERRRTGPGEQPDLIDALLGAQAAGDEGFRTEDELLIAAVGPYLAGLDTVANTCAFLLYALLKHPDVLARVLPEVTGVAPASPADLVGMTALQGAYLESLRMYPVATAIERHVTAPFELGGYTLPAGKEVLIATTAAHFDPALYREPRVFDIDRFRAPRQEHKGRGAWAPFGLGAHTCLGASLAEVQILLILATFLRALDVRLAPPDQELRPKIDPVPTPGPAFHVRVVGRRG